MGEMTDGGSFSPKMDHLACFLADTLALGHHTGADPSSATGGGAAGDHLKLAIELGETCVHGYDMTASGLAPEIWWYVRI